MNHHNYAAPPKRERDSRNEREAARTIVDEVERELQEEQIARAERAYKWAEPEPNFRWDWVAVIGSLVAVVSLIALAVVLTQRGMLTW